MKMSPPPKEDDDSGEEEEEDDEQGATCGHAGITIALMNSGFAVMCAKNGSLENV